MRMSLTLSAPSGQRVPKTFPRKGGKRPLIVELFRSPVALKWIMAWSGIAGMGFVLVHMVGNLHLYEGPEEVNNYAEALRTIGGDLLPRGTVLWVMRLGLVTAVLVHIYAAYRLSVVNHQARPIKYQSKRDYLAADFASRTMRLSGIWLTFFILYHLADLTWGIGITRDDFIHGDPYSNVVESLSMPLVAAFYIVSMAALSFHLYHGAWSIFQSLGVNNPRYNSVRRGFATLFALVVLIGNISFPVMVSLGVIDQDDRCWPTPEQIEHEEELLGRQISTADIERQISAGACPFRGDAAPPAGDSPGATTPSPEDTE
jgi:succinate dehydrogenase / fumarate reductase cytochrome b subunit